MNTRKTFARGVAGSAMAKDSGFALMRCTEKRNHLDWSIGCNILVYQRIYIGISTTIQRYI